uniref:Meiosis 1 associated protein n=1 Tax=Amphiprion percula TaxID=161767 RepID=A0A3P8U017_AMPPE
MDNRKRPAGSSNSGSLVFWSSSFQWQPARVLIVEALPPWWSQTCTVLCDALDNFLSLACSLDGPCRIPLLSLYAVSRQQECLLPFVQLRGNFARLHSCVEELRSIPGEGCIRGAARGGDLLRQAVLDSLQQFRHTNAGSQTRNNLSVEVSMTRPSINTIQKLVILKITHCKSFFGSCVVLRMSQKLSGITAAVVCPSADSLMLGTEVDLQQVANSVVAVEMVLKAWLQERGGDREHLHLLLPSPLDDLIPGQMTFFLHRGETCPSILICKLGLCVCLCRRVLRADGVCESVLYGLPLVIRPTTCWQLDWDEMETNHGLFHALCHTLRVCKYHQSINPCVCIHKPSVCVSAFVSNTGVYPHYVLQPSPSLSLLLRPVVSRELLLPISLPVSAQDPPPNAMQTRCLSQLDEEFVLNPLSLNSNLYQLLRNTGLLSQPRYPYRSEEVQSAIFNVMNVEVSNVRKGVDK